MRGVGDPVDRRLDLKQATIAHELAHYLLHEDEPEALERHLQWLYDAAFLHGQESVQLMASAQPTEPDQARVPSSWRRRRSRRP